MAEVGVVGDQEVDLPQQGLGSQEYQRGADREVRLGDADAVVLRDSRLTDHAGTNIFINTEIFLG